MTQEPDCYCETCERDIHHLGIAAHRAMHQRKFEACTITFSTGERKHYNFGPPPQLQDIKQ